MDIIEAIRIRRSVRTYNGRPLPPELTAEIEQSISQAHSPIDGRVTIKLASIDTGDDFRPSTYGIIKGARNYLLMGTDSTPASLLAGGYKMEQIVLKACQIGLATCWIGGTFNNKSFISAADLPDDEQLTVVSPIGFPSDKPRLMERIMREIAKSDKRKPLSELFFVNDFSVPVNENSPYRLPLEMMRMAPSSVNSQPWRGLVRGNQVDFYCSSDNKYSMIDMGIGLCHFMLAAEAQNINGVLLKNNMPIPAPENWQYVITFAEAD